MEQIEPVPFEDWTPNEFVPFSPRHVSVHPVPFEDWTPNRSVPFSSEHICVQPGSGSSLQFPYSNTFQRAENLYSDVIGQFCSQHSDDELESIENAINVEMQDLLTRCLLRGIAGNTCASCNARDDDGSLEGSARNDNDVSSSELENESSSSVDIDFYSPCLKCGTEAFIDSQPTGHCRLNSPCNNVNSSPKSQPTGHCSLNSPCNNVNSSPKRSVEDDWLADDNTDNINNACFCKKCKENHGSSAQSSVNAYKPCSEAPSKCDDNMTEHAQSDLSEGHSADNQSVCSQYSSEQNIATSPQASDTQVKQQSAKSSKAPLCRRRKEEKEENNKKNNKKNKKKDSNSKLAAESRAENWQVINISERCSIFEYKQEILQQQIPVHRSSFLHQVSLLSISLLHI